MLGFSRPWGNIFAAFFSFSLPYIFLFLQKEERFRSDKGGGGGGSPTRSKVSLSHQVLTYLPFFVLFQPSFRHTNCFGCIIIWFICIFFCVFLGSMVPLYQIQLELFFIIILGDSMNINLITVIFLIKVL